MRTVPNAIEENFTMPSLLRRVLPVVLMLLATPALAGDGPEWASYGGPVTMHPKKARPVAKVTRATPARAPANVLVFVASGVQIEGGSPISQQQQARIEGKKTEEPQAAPGHEGHHH